MATITRENIALHTEKILVSLQKEDYQPKFEKALKGYAKHANVPGFRKGHVPAGMVKKMYGQALFQEEVLNQASAAISEYLQNEKLAILGQPLIMPEASARVLEMNGTANLDFAFEIGLKPDFEVTALNGSQNLTQYNIQISDEMLQEEVARVAKRLGKVEELDVLSHPEHMIYAEYYPCDADGNMLEGMDSIKETSELKSLPVKLQEMVMGKKADDSLVINPTEICTDEERVNFAKTIVKVADVSNLADYYLLKIIKISAIIPREMDITFFGEVFPNDDILDEAAFNAKFRTELGKEFEAASTSRMRDEIYELLVHNTPIELPVAFLHRWLAEGQEKPQSMEQVQREFPAFEHQLRWTLISDKLLQEYGITVTREEVLDHMKSRVLSYFGLESSEDAPWMEGYMEKLEKEEKSMNETYRTMLFERLFDTLKTKFTIVEKDVTEKEFLELANPHDAHHHHHNH
ncbi:MAG: trigger factor [Bacteroidetes bacterium]|nr:trigger factor [Bacteroidota bacterium]